MEDETPTQEPRRVWIPNVDASEIHQLLIWRHHMGDAIFWGLIELDAKMMILSDFPDDGEVVRVGVIFHDLSMAPSWELTYFLPAKNFWVDDFLFPFAGTCYMVPGRVMANWYGKISLLFTGVSVHMFRCLQDFCMTSNSQDADAAAGAAVAVEIVALAKTNMSNEKGPTVGWVI